MIITIASGKGGTGKTTVAVSLALSLAATSPLFLDCDVEEPNAALFLAPDIEEEKEAGLLIAKIDPEKCNLSAQCARVCQYHAIAVIAERVLVFPELCHGCGSCTLSCPTGAISEVLHVLGTLARGAAGPIAFAQGTMNVGQAMAAPIIRQLKKWAIPADAGDCVVILDAPPGTACPVVETMRDSDVVLMVTEPTPFGLHDLRIAVQVARDELGLPVGVVVNRDGIGDTGVEDYCSSEGIPILMRIPIDRRIAEAYSDGIPSVEAVPEYREQFLELFQRIKGIAS